MSRRSFSSAARLDFLIFLSDILFVGSLAVSIGMFFVLGVSIEAAILIIAAALLSVLDWRLRAAKRRVISAEFRGGYTTLRPWLQGADLRSVRDGKIKSSAENFGTNGRTSSARHESEGSNTNQKSTRRFTLDFRLIWFLPSRERHIATAIWLIALAVLSYLAVFVAVGRTGVSTTSNSSFVFSAVLFLSVALSVLVTGSVKRRRMREKMHSLGKLVESSVVFAASDWDETRVALGRLERLGRIELNFTPEPKPLFLVSDGETVMLFDRDRAEPMTTTTLRSHDCFTILKTQFGGAMSLVVAIDLHVEPKTMVRIPFRVVNSVHGGKSSELPAEIERLVRSLTPQM